MQEVAGKKQNKGRKTFLDLLRVAATCAVVLMHTVTGMNLQPFDYVGHRERYYLFRALVDLTAWCVPVFLLISGYLFLDPDRDLTWRKMFGKYCRRVFLALLIFGVPYSFLELLLAQGTLRPGMLWEAVLRTAQGKSWAHMWYLYLIFLLYALTPLLRWILSKLPVPIVYGITAALWIGSSLIPLGARFAGNAGSILWMEKGIYLFYYLSGYLFCEGQRRSGSVPKGRGYLAEFAVLLAGQAALRALHAPVADMAYCDPITSVEALLLFAGAGSCLERSADAKAGSRGAKRLQELGALCFGIYLIHPVFLNFFYKYLGITLMDFALWLGLPLFFAVALLGSLLATWLLRKIPFFRKYIL